MKIEYAFINCCLSFLWQEQGNNKVALAEQLNIKKKELESIIEYKTKGGIIRSRARWYNEGEKNSNYFLNLENLI